MKRRIKVIADANIPFLSGALEPYAEVRYLPSSDIHQENIRGGDALFIRTRTRCGPQLLDGSHVRFIATASIGFDHIDTRYCESRHIKWVHAPGCNSWSVTQYVASALLTVARMKNFDLSRMTIGIVGVGNVGRKVAGLAQSLGLRVVLNDHAVIRQSRRLS
jgi:erythronate-4-phosphate dehydrogenase